MARLRGIFYIAIGLFIGLGGIAFRAMAIGIALIVLGSALIALGLYEVDRND